MYPYHFGCILSTYVFPRSTLDMARILAMVECHYLLNLEEKREKYEGAIGSNISWI